MRNLGLRSASWALAWGGLCAVGVSHALGAAGINVYGGPAYDVRTGGYLAPVIARASTTPLGSAVATVERIESGVSKGQRVIRWGASGTWEELGTLSTNPDGVAWTRARGVNSTGTAVGTASIWDSVYGPSWRAVRWDASGTTPTELGHLGIGMFNYAYAEAMAINDAGTAVGYAEKHVDGEYRGIAAVRWDAASTAAVELGNLGTTSNGTGRSKALDINADGVAVGYAAKYDGGRNRGSRAVRWRANGVAEELGHLGTQSDGDTDAEAIAVNDAGAAIGWAKKFWAGNEVGRRPVYWARSATAATELPMLVTPTTPAGTYINGSTVAINAGGLIVGNVEKDAGGVDLGLRAVRWDVTTDPLHATVTELGTLGTKADGTSYCRATDVNAAGITIGYAATYDAMDEFVSYEAVYWDADGAAVKLIDLIDPTSGWVALEGACDTTDSNWIAGYGSFDPDGLGGAVPYTRLFMLQLPEPAATMAMAGLLLALRSSRRACPRHQM